MTCMNTQYTDSAIEKRTRYCDTDGLYSDFAYLHWLEDGMVVLSSGEEELHSKGPEVPVRIVLVTNVDHILQFCLQLSEGWGERGMEVGCDQSEG